MAFWSGEKLAIELPKGLIEPYELKNLDCASYRLCVGEQAFVTSDKFVNSAPSDPLITKLGDLPNHTLRIPPGQFAFLLTHEIVHVPANAIALISMRAKYKFKGLINVSGFHVDPGWRGKLLFSVYNAGASEIIIEKGEALFLIVYSDLDQPSKKPHIYEGSSQNQANIKTELVKDMTGQVFSPLMLQRQVEDLKQKHDGLSVKANILVAASSVVGIVLALVIAAIGLIIALPNFSGVFVATILESAGYEVKKSKDIQAAKDVAPEKEQTKAIAPAKSIVVEIQKTK